MRALLPTFLEAVFVGVGLVGVGMVFLPAALILGAVLGVIAIERHEQVKK